MPREPHLPVTLPAGRILGPADDARRRLLGCIDVVVGYVSARHRAALRGWHLEAALVETRPSFRGGETVAIRAWPEPGFDLEDLRPVPFGVLREIASRCCDGLDGIANVVPDIASNAPEPERAPDAPAGCFVVIDEDEPWFGGSIVSA